MLIPAILKLRKWIHRTTSLCSQAQHKLERFVTGHWWWKHKRDLAVRKLEKVLETEGENSISARRAINELRKADFAYIYGRPTSAEIQTVVKVIRKSGQVPLSALWTLVINCDLLGTSNGVRVRRAWWIKPLMYTAHGVNLTFMTYLVFHIFFHPSAVSIKALTVLGILLIYGPFYMVWHLYTLRPIVVIQRYGILIDQMAMRIRPHSSVTCRHPHPTK